VSNQGGISLRPDPKTVKSDQKRLADFKAKVSAVFNQLDIPISVYAATARDKYRKPRTGMWDEMLDEYDLDSAHSVDLENSFFVGDAGGREALNGGAKDHSCVDRLVEHLNHASLILYGVLTIARDFAANVGVMFHTPEEYFVKEEPRPFTRNFDPTVYLKERELVEKPSSACTFLGYQPVRVLCYHPRSDASAQYPQSPRQKPSILFCFVAAQGPGSHHTTGETYSH
jgi:bifunctional polynucleotide phosphatase/kinase